MISFAICCDLVKLFTVENKSVDTMDCFVSVSEAKIFSNLEKKCVDFYKVIDEAENFF